MGVDAKCQRCWVEDESLGHALFNCSRSWDFWMSSPFGDLCEEVRMFKFDEIIQRAKDKFKEEALENFLAYL